MKQESKRKNEIEKVYSFKDFWKRHKILLIILCGIPIISCVVFIPLIVCKEINIWDLGSFFGGLLAYVGTALLGAVSMWQNERQKIENDKALAEERERAAIDKQILMEQNKRMAYDNARLSVIPVISVRRIFYRNKKSIFDLSESSSEEDEEYGYSESNSKYFAITLGLDEVTVHTKETKDIKSFKESPFKMQQDKNGAMILKPRTDSYLPFEISNVGRGNANKFSFAIYKEGCTDKQLRKYIIARPFMLTDVLRLDIYIPNTAAEAIYWLEFTYEDILGNKYEQKDYFKIHGENSIFSLDFPQTLQEPFNG